MGKYCDEESQETGGLGKTQKIVHLIFPLVGFFFCLFHSPEMTVSICLCYRNQVDYCNCGAGCGVGPGHRDRRCVRLQT